MNKYSSPLSSALNADSSFTTTGTKFQTKAKRVTEPDSEFESDHYAPGHLPGQISGQNGVQKSVQKSVVNSSQTISFDPELAAKIDALEKAQAATRKIICPECGAESQSKSNRLTCDSCGNYLESGVQTTIWDKSLTLGKLSGLGEEDLQVAAMRSYLMKRVLAKIADTIVLGSIVMMEAVASFSVIRACSVVPQLSPLLLGFFMYGLPICLLITILSYQAAFESSPVQATPGKLLTGLYVLGTDEHQARFEPLFFKALISAFPGLIFGGVYLYFFLEKLRYGLRLDAVSMSVFAVSAIACFVTFLALHIIVGSEKKRQTVPDALTGIVVLER